MDRTDLITALTRAAQSDPRISALLLTGSLGAGGGDVWSDIDVLLVAKPEAHADLVASARDWVTAIAPPILWRQLYPPHPLFHAVLPGWLRLDATFTVPDHILTVRTASTPLHDPDNLHGRLPERLPSRQPDPKKIAAIVEEFLRIMGLAPVAVGRGDLLGASRGWELLRGLLLDLLVEAQAPPLPAGALATTRLLPPDDLALITSLPIPHLDREALLAAQMTPAEAFLARSKPLAAASGEVWPTVLEEEMRARLQRDLSIQLPA
jgi:hypothetical protein